MTEAEYWADYQIRENEVATAIENFYANIKMKNYAAEDPAVLRGFNEAPTFWITAGYGLIATFFISLGRVFDEDGNAHSIHKLLRATGAHPEYFSRNALAERKRQLSGHGEPVWLADYMKDVWEPDAKDLRVFGRTLNPSVKKYKEVYKPIRDKVIAHKELKDAASIDVLFGKTLIIEIEEILKALHVWLAAVGQLYLNGIKPEFGLQDYSYQTRIERIKTTTRCALANVRRPLPG